MKFIHMSDLHLGKRFKEYSLIEDQEYILKKILSIIDEQKPDGVIIAGDVYDKPIPPAEAVELFDNFLVRLSKRDLKVFIISGNHDSAERIAFGGRLMDKSGIYISPVYDGKVEPITLTDKFGEVCVYMLPFIKPSNVKRFYPDAEIDSYTDAIRVAVEEMHIDEKRRNVLISHQFVTGAARSDSEEISVGGTDNVDVTAFDGFDYVALGHIHRAQKCVRDTVRYSGTPLKYSFSEAKNTKSVTVIELKDKGDISFDLIPITPLRDVVEIKGAFEEITSNAEYSEDYMHITLTNEEEIPDALTKLRVYYKNVMTLDYDNSRTRATGDIDGIENVDSKSPLQLFAEFYEAQNGRELNEEQQEFMLDLINQLWEDWGDVE